MDNATLDEGAAPTPDNIAWLHKFINCVPFGADAPLSDIQRAHDIVSRTVAGARQAQDNAKDAERYRTMRTDGSWLGSGAIGLQNTWLRNAGLDAAIDAAITAATPGKGDVT